MNKLKKWLSENKDNPTFKHTVIIVVLIILAIAAQLFDNWRDTWDTTETASEIVAEETEDEKNTVAEIIDSSKGHVIMLCITGTALAVVQYKKKHKIKESR